jgi:predicted nucleotidyltransferase
MYPTSEHQRAAQAIVEFFAALPEVEAVILYGSCARGKACRDSCLDVLILVRPEAPAPTRATLARRWRDFYAEAEVFQALLQVGQYSHVDLDLTDGCFVPRARGWTGGPDAFELEIGNTLVYTVALWERGDYLERLQAQWLPYYDELLRQERLPMVLRYCHNNLDHIPLFADRGLHFQAFKRFYDAFREFLQALFIARRTYPIAYDKWIREQVEDILGMPELYRQLPRLLEIERFESAEIARKAKELENLLESYVVQRCDERREEQA